jgi:hypothetical protein
MNAGKQDKYRGVKNSRGKETKSCRKEETDKGVK